MTAEVYTVKVGVVVNWRRFYHMQAHAIAVLRRAPKRDRKAMLDRFARNMAQKCTKVRVLS